MAPVTAPPSFSPLTMLQDLPPPLPPPTPSALPLLLSKTLWPGSPCLPRLVGRPALLAPELLRRPGPPSPSGTVSCFCEAVFHLMPQALQTVTCAPSISALRHSDVRLVLHTWHDFDGSAMRPLRLRGGLGGRGSAGVVAGGGAAAASVEDGGGADWEGAELACAGGRLGLADGAGAALPR